MPDCAFRFEEWKPSYAALRSAPRTTICTKKSVSLDVHLLEHSSERWLDVLGDDDLIQLAQPQQLSPLSQPCRLHAAAAARQRAR